MTFQRWTGLKALEATHLPHGGQLFLLRDIDVRRGDTNGKEASLERALDLEMKTPWRQQCLDSRQFVRMLMRGIALRAQGTGALLSRLEIEFENALISFVGDV